MRINTTNAFLSVSILAALCSTTAAQNWELPMSGAWSNDDSWTGDMVPGPDAVVQLPDFGTPYTVAVDTSPVLSALSVLGADTTMSILGGEDIDIGTGGLINSGTIRIASGGAVGGTAVNMLLTSNAISGSGTIILQDESVALLQSDSTPTLTIALAQTVEGAGRVTALSSSTIVMNGVYDANIPGQTLKLTGSHDLALGGIAMSSNGGTLLFEVADVVGGIITDAEFFQSDIGGGTTLLGVNRVQPTRSARLADSNLFNNGTLELPAGNQGQVTSVDTIEDFLVEGTGTVRLGDGASPGNALLQTSAAVTLTIGPGQTISGAGRINAGFGGTVAMRGNYLADIPATELVLLGDHDLIGGSATGTDGTIVFLSASLTGGDFLGSVHLASTTLGGVAMQNDNGVRAGVSTLTAQSLTNDGVLTLNVLGGTNPSQLLLEDGADILGTGSIVLNAAPANPFTTSIRADIDATASLGPAQRIEGNGVLSGGFAPGRLTIAGDIAPGFGPGDTSAILLSGQVFLTPTTTCELEFASLTDFDQFDEGGGAAPTLDGELDLTLVGGYVPSTGDRFRIVDATVLTGGFDPVRTTVTAGAGFRLEQTGADLDAVWTCLADTNGDGMVSPADFNGWILAFNTQAPECDQNGDGLCTPADFNGWILNFNSGCS